MNNKKVYIVSIISCIIDQIIKLIISTNINIGSTLTFIKNIFYLTYVKNSGAAFSSFANNRLFLILVALIVLFVLFKFVSKENLDKIETYSYGIIIGGILGNLIDRIFIGSVIDYISIKIFNYYFPIFNLADSFIIIGVILLIIDSIRKRSV